MSLQRLFVARLEPGFDADDHALVANQTGRRPPMQVYFSPATAFPLSRTCASSDAFADKFFRLIPGVDGKNDKSLSFVLLVEFRQVGGLDAAGTTSNCRKGDQGDLSTNQLRQRNFPARQIPKREIRSPAGLSRRQRFAFGAPVPTTSKKGSDWSSSLGGNSMKRAEPSPVIALKPPL